MFKLEVPKNFLEELDIAMAKNNKAQKSYDDWKHKKIFELEAKASQGALSPYNIHEETQLRRLGIYDLVEIRERKLQERYGLIDKSYNSFKKISKELKAFSKEISLDVKSRKLSLEEADDLKVGMVLRSTNFLK